MPEPDALIVYYHGGGSVVGDICAHANLGEPLAAHSSLGQSGVPLRFSRRTGRMHGFFSMYSTLTAAVMAMSEIVDAIRRRLAA